MGSSENARRDPNVIPIDSAVRTPPSSIRAEESILGSILLDNDSINTVAEKVRATDFYRPAHRVIFEAMLNLSDKQEPVDIVTLSQELQATGKLEQCGGPQELGRFSTIVPSSANVAYYARIVRDMSMRRAVIHACSEVIESAFKAEGDTDEFLGDMEQKLFKVSSQRSSAAFEPVSNIVQESIRLVEQRYDNKGMVTGVPTGFTALDHMTAGFQPSDLVVIAARPAMGKTALALSVAGWVGISEQKAIAIFSLEMSKEQIVLRMLCSEASVENTKVRSGNLSDSDFPKLVDAASRVADAPIFIDDTPAITISELRAKARRLDREHKLSLIMVDYLQLMRSPSYKNNREQEIADISRSLKALAKELNVPVIALSQLNRSVESRNDKRPMMSDLRESGAIEQDADIIMFIYRDEVYNEDTPDRGIAELIISKQRSGPTGIVRTAFSGEYTRFSNLDEQHDTDSYIGDEMEIPPEDELF